MYRAVLTGEVTREGASRAGTAWWAREPEWSDDAVLRDAVEGLGFMDLRHGPDSDYLYSGDQLADWLRALESGRRFGEE